MALAVAVAGARNEYWGDARVRISAACVVIAGQELGSHLITPIAALALTIGGAWSLASGSLILIAPAGMLAIVLGLKVPAYGRLAIEGLARPAVRRVALFKAP